jgi:hypothetical protein
MYENPNYFEAITQDSKTNKCEGLIMFLHIEAIDGKKYLFFGPNPFERLLSRVSSEQCFNHQYEIAIRFAKENGYDGVVVPSKENQILGSCTNRGGDYPELIKKKRLQDGNGNIKVVEFGNTHILGNHQGTNYAYTNGALIWEK